MRPGVAVAFLSFVMVPFGAVCVVGAFAFVARGEFPSAVVALGFAVFALGLIAMLGVVASKRVAPRVLVDDEGTAVRPDAKVDGLLTTATICGFIAMAGYAVCAPLGLVDIPVPRGDVRYFVIACAAGALIGMFGVVHAVRQRGMSLLVMTPTHIVIGTATSTKEVAWADVIDVVDGGKATGTTYVRVEGGRSITLTGDWYTPGGSSLRNLVRFYWEHPNKRDELVDDRARMRLESGGGT